MPAGYDKTRYTFLGSTRDVYEAGEGPSVLLMAEMPGITPGVSSFGQRLVADGFHVVMPDLFGRTDAPFSNAASVREIVKGCISREFHTLASHRASPITDWLRELCRHLHQQRGGPVGAIGMCFTGNFALALAVDEWLMAPVLSQPSLPFPLSPSKRRAIHLSPAGLAKVKRRCQGDGLRVLGLRFTKDPLCPAARFHTLSTELGEAFHRVEIDSSWGNPAGIPRAAHSVLVLEYRSAPDHPTRLAYQRLVEFLREQLGVGSPLH